ncbi:hypothetical protein K270103H11_18130 [Gordonibacter urolithinfaciens]
MLAVEWSIVAEAACGVAVSAALIVWGSFVLKGNARGFRLLAGGRDFLALDPDEEAYRKTSRESGLAIYLVAVCILCAIAYDIAPRIDVLAVALTPIREAILVVGVSSAVAIVAIAIMQLLRYRRLLSKRR